MPCRTIDALTDQCECGRQFSATGTVLRLTDLRSFAYRSLPFYASKGLIDIWWPFVRGDKLLFHLIMLLISTDRDNMRTLQMHISVLTHIVNQRGGLSAFKAENQMAAHVLFWCALVAINEPSLLSLSDEDSLDMPDQSHSTKQITLLTNDGGEADLLDLGLDPQISYVLHEVQRLPRLYTSTLIHSNPGEAMDSRI